MVTSYFYLQAQKNDANAGLINDLESYSVVNRTQIYIVDSPLGDSKYSYDFIDGFVLLIPNRKIIFVNFGNDDKFENYMEDFIEDLGSISDKF